MYEMIISVVLMLVSVVLFIRESLKDDEARNNALVVLYGIMLFISLLCIWYSMVVPVINAINFHTL